MLFFYFLKLKEQRVFYKIDFQFIIQLKTLLGNLRCIIFSVVYFECYLPSKGTTYIGDIVDVDMYFGGSLLFFTRA